MNHTETSGASHEQDVLYFRRSRRIILRPLLRSDMNDLMRWINDPGVHRFLLNQVPMMEAEEEDWIESIPKRKPHEYIVGVVADDRLIGTMGLHGINYLHGIATTGAMIGESAYWGRGYGTEAKMLLLDFAFNTLNLRKVTSRVIEYNPRSVSYSKKCGYKEEGRLKAQFVFHGRCWDEILLAVFRDDWVPLWDTFARENEISRI